MKLLDEDGGGTVDRLEYISYLMSPAGEGPGHFDLNLKKMYDQCDTNKDGLIDSEEFTQFMLETFNEMIKEKSEQGQEAASSVVRSLAFEIFLELDKDK